MIPEKVKLEFRENVPRKLDTRVVWRNYIRDTWKG